METLPSGTVTFLFSDIEGSTKLAHEYAEAWESARARHHAILHDAVESNHGYVFQIIGDSFSTVFHTAGDALKAATKAQEYLKNEAWIKSPIKIRMGIHTGTAQARVMEERAGGYVGYITLSFVQRVMSIGHGGQILISNASAELIRNELPDEVTLQNMGNHHLKGLPNLEQIWQVNVPGLQHEFPPLNSSKILSNNLPVQLTSFVGREKEIGEVKDALALHRLVTLIGPGGTGKTRLSIQVAGELLDQYPDGAWFVELAPISDPLLLPRTTAIAIGLRDEPQRPVIDMLCDYLHGKHLLLILDNCEHLVEACAQLADTLLHACPQIRILASSREALGIAGETSYLVPSLELPDMQNLPTVEALSQSEAVRLFIERASAATQKFMVTDENASSIAQICYRLDGIPLAIELAAGKIRALSTHQIAQRLDNRFRLLTSGSRTALPRHQTLRAAIDWSYDLLSPAEQTLFRRLSVFVNGWTLEAAESVCSDQDTTTKDTLKTEDILELLIQLVNKTLVVAEERNSEVCYHMLETIRQFANDKLIETGESDALYDQHLGFFIQLAETADPLLRTTEQIEWLGRLDDEHDNLRSSLQWSLGKSSAKPALRLVGSLAVYWKMRCLWLEGATWLERALKKPSVGLEEMTRSEKAARAKALYGDAMLIFNLDDLDRTQSSAEASLHLFEELGDRLGAARSRTWFAHSLARRGNSGSTPLLEKSLAEFRDLNDPAGQHSVLYVQLGDYHQTEGAKKAKEVALEALKLARISGNRLIIAYGLSELAYYYFLCGELDRAVTTKNEANEMFESLGHRGNLVLLGIIAYLRRDYHQARKYLTKSISDFETLGERLFRSSALFWLGMTYQDEGNLEQAREFLEKALAVQEAVGLGIDPVPHTLCMLGKVLGQQGDLRGAILRTRESLSLIRDFSLEIQKAEILILTSWLFVERSPQAGICILAAAHTKHETLDSPLHPVAKTFNDQYLALARSRLDESAFNAAWAEGEKMSLDEALDLALKTLEEM